MSNQDKKKKAQELSRRDFLRLTGIAAAGTIIVSCGSPAAPVTEATTAPAGETATAAPTRSTRRRTSTT